MTFPLLSRTTQISNPNRSTVIDFEPLLDAIEAAALLRMHPNTLRMKARLGEVPGRHIGKYWRFRISDLNDRLRRKMLDCALLPMPVTEDDFVVLQIGSTPLVVCMRTDDPLAQLTEIRPAEMADRLTVFRDPESHPSAHKRLPQILAECGVRAEVSCAVATPADVQWMIRRGFGLALIDGQMKLDPSLTSRAVAGVAWTADTAFVHQSEAEHLALPLLTRHLRKAGKPRPRRSEQRGKAREPVQMELLT